MRKDVIAWSVPALVSVSLFSWALTFYQDERNSCDQKGALCQSLRQQLIVLERDRVFLKSHERELKGLEEKGWDLPQSRLIAQEFLQTLGKNFEEVEYSFAPEQFLDLDGHSYAVTRVIWSGAAVLDSDIFTFIDELTHGFPGVLRIHAMTLSRRGEGGRSFILSTLVFDWVSRAR